MRFLQLRPHLPPRPSAQMVSQRSPCHPRSQFPALTAPNAYTLSAPQITEDVKRDLRLLRLRGAYDPKRFYKSFDETKFPKYFQVRVYGWVLIGRGGIGSTYFQVR